MTTLTPTEARVNLSSLLRRALDGHEIGIVTRGRVVALRPVEVIAADYAQREYGLKPAQARKLAGNLRRRARQNVSEGKSRTYHGDIEALLAR